MAVLSGAHPTAPDVRLTVQSVTRPTHGEKSHVSINPHSDFFRPYVWRAPRREGLVPTVPKGV